MKKVLFILFVIVSIADSFCKSNANYNYPKLKLDDYYSYFKSDTATDTTTHDYEIKPSEGFILVTKGYDFTKLKKANNNLLPEFIHLLIKESVFRVRLNPTGETIVDQSTIEQVDTNGNIDFVGFKKGQKVVFSLGTGSFQDSAYVIKPVWVTLINIE